ncbi:MAG: hypothetical protein PT120_12005, partial [Aphanizomenon gracile PMC649.10]|nr:hypothetical protein [Aphanizomenon gracile PMC649.10]
KNLLNLLLWKYQIIPIYLDSIQDPDLILTLYDRLKEFYHPNITRQGVGDILSVTENNHGQIKHDSFNHIYKEVEGKFNVNRLGDLFKQDNQGKYFCAIVKPENKIVTGIFLRFHAVKAREFIFYKTETNKEQEIQKILLSENLVTFKIIEKEDKEILHKFGFM